MSFILLFHNSLFKNQWEHGNIHFNHVVYCGVCLRKISIEPRVIIAPSDHRRYRVHRFSNLKGHAYIR